MATKLEVVQVPLDDEEFHFVIGAVFGATASQLGKMEDVLRAAQYCQRWMRELGDERMDALLKRFNDLHDHLCPDEEPNERA